MSKIPDRSFRAPLAIGLAAAAAVISYSAVAAYPYLRGPILAVDPIFEGPSGTIISGATTRVSSLTVGGLPIALDETGAFSVARTYPPGYTVVVVAALDRFGRARERTLTFVTNPYDSEKSKTGGEGSEE